LGFGIMVVGGADPDSVTLTTAVTNSHTGPSDVAVFPYAPDPNFSGPTPPSHPAAKAFVIPHVLERSSSTSQYTFDTTLYATYAGGLAGIPDYGGANVDLYLFDSQTGAAAKSATGQVVCNPCSFPVGGSAIKNKNTNITDVYTLKGGMPVDTNISDFGVV